MIEAGMNELNIELNELERIEADAGLGNGERTFKRALWIRLLH